MTLAVVTHYNPEKKSQWFDEMLDSVAKNLPRDATHHLIPCRSTEEFNRMRWEALSLAEYVCFVDDDDIVINDSINRCLKVIQDNPDVGVVFTDEKYIDEMGEEIESIHEKDRSTSYYTASQSAQTIHHLAMIRTSKVDWTARRIDEQLGSVCSCWLIKAGTAIKSAAIHLPFQGYEWRHHTSQISKGAVWNEAYSKKIKVIRTYLSSQITYGGTIPQLPVPE